jgi:hypothetical protein
MRGWPRHLEEDKRTSGVGKDIINDPVSLETRRIVEETVEVALLRASDAV